MATREPTEGAEGRRAAIVREVSAKGRCSIDDLAERFQVSRMTVHRDLDLLQSQGLVHKKRGWASAESSLLFESNFYYRRHQQIEIKRALAARASRLIEPGQVILLDDSTTILPIAEQIHDVENLTVITNSLPVVEVLENSHNIDLIVTGGTCNRNLRAFFGRACEASLELFRCDLAFLSVPAVRSGVLYHQHQEVVRAKRSMMAIAEKTVLLLDPSKIGRSAMNRLGRLDEFDSIVTDRSGWAHLGEEVRDKILLDTD